MFIVGAQYGALDLADEDIGNASTVADFMGAVFFVDREDCLYHFGGKSSYLFDEAWINILQDLRFFALDPQKVVGEWCAGNSFLYIMLCF